MDGQNSVAKADVSVSSRKPCSLQNNSSHALDSDKPVKPRLNLTFSIMKNQNFILSRLQLRFNVFHCSNK